MLHSVFRGHVTRPIRLGLQARNASTHARAYQPLQPYQTPQQQGSGSSGKAKEKWTFAPYILGGLAIGIGFYVTQLVIAAKQPCQNPLVKQLDHQKDVAARYDETADDFDSEVGTSEALMGINTIRDRLSKMCKGHVLEVSCGTGRNLGYYNLSRTSQVDSLTFVDLSKQMVDVCKKKWTSLYGPSDTKDFKPGLTVRFLAGSGLDAMPLAPGEKKYDTIIQTMGLCSTPSPLELMQNMALHLNTANPDARILLLEHGRSYREWLNNILDNSAQKHADIHGCWFNRDIGALVQEAADNSGLEIVRERRHHLGTTWVFELKPKVTAPQQPTASSDQTTGVQSAGQEASKGYGWRGLIGWK